MKKIAILISIVLSSNLYATGGFECNLESTGSLVAFGTTASVVGNPLISLTIIENGLEKTYSRDQIVGYWNIGTQLKVAVTDRDYLTLEYVLETNSKSPGLYDGESSGTLKTQLGQSLEVVCLF